MEVERFYCFIISYNTNIQLKGKTPKNIDFLKLPFSVTSFYIIDKGGYLKRGIVQQYDCKEK
jgi:hypothetical protein